jgi:hypothetical protein
MTKTKGERKMRQETDGRKERAENERLVKPRSASICSECTALMRRGDCRRRLDENLEHLLAINDMRVCFGIGLADVSASIAWWRSDWELRSEGGQRIIPDGLFLIKWHETKDQAYALEVDNNTKSARNFLKKIWPMIHCSVEASEFTAFRSRSY